MASPSCFAIIDIEHLFAFSGLAGEVNTVLVGVKVKLDPTPRQERALVSHAGAARFAYNFMLSRVKAALAHRVGRVGWSHYDLRREWNTWKSEVAPWWRENSKEAYSYGMECLARALKNWLDSCRGKRKGRRTGFPHYKNKARCMRFAVTTGFRLDSADPKAVYLPRIGRIHCFENVIVRVGVGHTMRITLSREAGDWYASLTVKYPDTEPLPVPSCMVQPEYAVGVDLGLNTFATLSDGTRVDNPRHYRKAEKKLKAANKILSRRVKGSGRWEQAKLQVQRVHQRVVNLRRELIWRTARQLATAYRHVVIEDLNVAAMARSGLAKSIYDAAFGTFRQTLVHECAKTGACLTRTDRWYPSSKTCSKCGRVKTKLSLTNRVFICDNRDCEYAINGVDRDWNAAVNLAQLVAPSAGETLNARGGNIRRTVLKPATQIPVKRELSNLRV